MGFLKDLFGKKNAEKKTAESAPEEKKETPVKSEEAEPEAPKAEEPKAEAPKPEAAQPEKPAAKNPLTVEQQQKWLRAVNDAFPALMVGTATGVDAPLRKADPSDQKGPNSLLNCIALCAKQMNDTFGMADLDLAAKRWPNLSDAQILEAHEALTWYSHILKEEFRQGIAKACTKVEDECRARNLTIPAVATQVKIDLMATLRGMPVACVMTVPGLAKAWPAVDATGFIHIFDSEEEVKPQAEKLAFQVQKMTGTEMCAKLPEWGSVGMTRIYLHKDGRIMRLQLNIPVFNGGLQLQMVRFLQSVRGTSNEQKAYTATLLNLLCHQIPQTLFFVAIGSEDDKPGTVIEDNNLRVFAHAGEILKEQNEKGHPISFRGFPYAAQPDAKPMSLRTMRNGVTNEEILAAFTDLGGALSVWKGKARFAVAGYDDLKGFITEKRSVVINPNGQSLRVNRKFADQIEQERGQKPKVFVFKKEGAAAEKPGEQSDAVFPEQKKEE